MDEEFLHQDEPQENQDHYSERASVHVTGDDRVDDAVAPLGRLGALPPEEHVVVLEEMYGRLRDLLGELDAADEPKSPDGPVDPVDPMGRR
jgi:hypothetical protein